jgi:hypothetical protein
MSVTQTVEVPASRREKILQARELELINRNAERLNIEAMDVLSFQSLDI